MTSAAVWVWFPESMRMSNGASSLYEKPLSGMSSWGDETPRSNRKQSTPGTCASTRRSSRSAKFPLRNRWVASGTSREKRSVAAARAMSSWSIPMERPSGATLLASSTECPAPPRVQSQTTSPGCGSSSRRTSASITGTCRYSSVKAFSPMATRRRAATRACRPRRRR